MLHNEQADALFLIIGVVMTLCNRQIVLLKGAFKFSERSPGAHVQVGGFVLPEGGHGMKIAFFSESIGFFESWTHILCHMVYDEDVGAARLTEHRADQQVSADANRLHCGPVPKGGCT